MNGVRNIAFTEMQGSTSQKLRRMTTSAISGTEKNPLITTKLVDIDQKMQVSVVVMGRHISIDELQMKDDIATIEDVKSFLQSLHEMPICGGGPKTSVYPQAHRESASVDECNLWRHKKCPLFVRGNKSTCKWRSSLSDTLRIHQKTTDKKNGTRPTKHFVQASHLYEIVTACLLSVRLGTR